MSEGKGQYLHAPVSPKVLACLMSCMARVSKGCNIRSQVLIVVLLICMQIIWCFNRRQLGDRD